MPSARSAARPWGPARTPGPRRLDGRPRWDGWELRVEQSCRRIGFRNSRRVSQQVPSGRPDRKGPRPTNRPSNELPILQCAVAPSP